jgi:LuxR family transcriptional regulator, maltose regulon positive regulatory protein
MRVPSAGARAAGRLPGQDPAGLRPEARRAEYRCGGGARPLTSRERQVLGLLATGKANRGIADQLVVTVDTVKRHVTHILAKLGAVNRTEAVARARALNLIP